MSLKYVNQSLGQVSYAAHLGGAFVGLTFGFLTLKNFKRKPWEDCIWRICIIRKQNIQLEFFKFCSSLCCCDSCSHRMELHLSRTQHHQRRKPTEGAQRIKKPLR